MKKLILLLLSLTGWFSVNAQISISAAFSSNIPAGTSVDADVKINKGNLGNFAKYQMDVPPGYSVAGIDVKGGNFTFENQRAKIVWVSVPSEPEFSIKLKITGEASATNQGSIVQKFFYLENNEKKEVEGPSVSLDGTAGADAVTHTSGTAASNTVAVQSVPVEEATPVSTTSTSGPGSSTPYTTNNTSSGNNVNTTSTPTAAVQTVQIPAETKPAETKPVTNTNVAKTSNPPAEKVITGSTPPTNTATAASADGMSYKIQLGAFSNEPPKSRFAGAGNVSIDRVDGLYKVTIGSFSSKEEAFRRREELSRKGYDGFVVTYKNGLRVR